MKDICRDFTIVIRVPDYVKPEDCEIVIEEASASYPSLSGSSYIDVPEHDMGIHTGEPY